jgi:hypothetical protein
MARDEGAAGALAAALTAALREVRGLSQVAEGAPVRSGDACATIELGPETDWGHKSGDGREIRVALLVRCGGEAPGRARALLEQARAAAAAIGPALGEWRLVTLAPMRARMVREPGPSWTGVAEYRARLMREA